MHDSLVKYCREYSQKLHPVYSDDDWFFASRKGQYHEGTIYHYFRELLFRAGISHGGRGMARGCMTCDIHFASKASTIC